MNKDKQLKILLIEDSPTDASLLRENIMLSGTSDISVTVAASLSEACDHCENNHFDAALLDLTLPDSSGLETVRLAMKHCPDMPIVVLTGIDDEQIGVEAVRMGVQDYLVKGQTDGRSIVRAIRYAIERKQAEEKLQKENREIALANQILRVFVEETGDDMFDQALHILLEGTGSRHGVFGYIDERGHLICPSMSKLLEQCEVEGKCIHYPPEKWKGLWARALRGKQILYTNEAPAVPPGHVPIRRNLAVPILFQGNVIGLWNLANKQTDYTEEDMVFLRAVANRIAPVLFAWIQKELRENERKRMEEELRKASNELEQRVKERTSELADALVALQDQMEERKKIQNALIDSELKYRELVENANSIIMRCNADGTITFFNEFAQKFFGFSEKEIIGRNIIGTIAPRTDSAGRDLEAIVAKISKNPEAYQNFESENMCRDGRRVWVNWANRPIKGTDGRVIEVLSVGNDITYRKQAEAKIQEYDSQLRSLTAELVLVEEDERRKIAEALHDSIGPLLAFSERELGNLQRFAPKEIALSLDEVKHHINDAVKQTRSLTFDLSPSSLYDLGFEDAVEELTEQFSHERNLKCSFKNSDEPKPLTEEAKILLYRSIRELLVNIAKHADAKTASVNLATLDSNIEITIKDNGKGFDIKKLDAKSAKSRGFGLFSIRERLTHIGGRFDIESRKGKGTKVTLIAPLDLAKSK